MLELTAVRVIKFIECAVNGIQLRKKYSGCDLNQKTFVGEKFMLKKAKSILVLTVALWGLFGALHNLMDWSGTLGAVGAVTSMVTFEGGSESWQATSQPWLIWLGALFIVTSKTAAGALCLVGSIGMWRSDESDLVAYKSAKKYALTGCAVAMIMLFGGFIVIAESWFELWRSETMLGPVLQSAFRYGAMITLIGLFVASKDS